jgi:redox-sensitive bicupin YhaK (pirin superfamily)
MINIIKSEDRHTADFGWLQTRWHFSFGDYRDPANVQWSKLRVFNDDVVQGGGGFDLHPHHLRPRRRTGAPGQRRQQRRRPPG